MRKTLAIVAWCAALAAPAQAADSDGKFAVEGVGEAPCQAFVEARAARSVDYFAFEGWIEGFVTAANLYLPQTYDLTPWESTEVLAAVIETNCRREPDFAFVLMVRKLLREIDGQRLTVRPE